MYKVNVETGSPKYFCCICQNEKTDEYFLSKCNHKWCIDCHNKLKENTNLCPLCREEFARAYEPEIDRTRKFAFYIAIIIHTIFCCVLLLLGRLYYMLLFGMNYDNFFGNSDLFLLTTVAGTLLLSVSIGVLMILSYFIYRFCKTI
tara:strand:+ start:353 stop:790 length:438 start_codon:yes stop_codon:yes gene_type:complete